MKKKDWMPFEEARTYVHKFNLKTKTDWEMFSKSGKRPKNIPSEPYYVYKHKGWAGFGDWLGTGRIATYFKVFRSFEEARSFVHQLKLKNYAEWRNYYKSDSKPSDIPTNPSVIYKDKGWSGYGDWFGKVPAHLRIQNFLPFAKARTFVHTLNLKNRKEWFEYYKSGSKPSDIPTYPSAIYKDKGWLGYSDWLGNLPADLQIQKFLPFTEARAIVHTLNLKNRKEWFEYYKSGKKPDNLPVYPDIKYKRRGWNGWDDWLIEGNTATLGV